MVDALALPAFLLFFAGLWCAVSMLIAQIGGWAELAQQYRCWHAPDGVRFRMQSANLGSAHYGSCLSLCVAAEGLYLAVSLPFRIGHPPLLIPWSDLQHYRTTRWLFWRHVEFQVGATRRVLKLSPKILRAAHEHGYLAESAGEDFSAPGAFDLWRRAAAWENTCTWVWIWNRLLAPLLIAGQFFLFRWGQDNVVFVIAVPVFFLIGNMYLSWQQRPECPPLEGFPPLGRALNWWHACDVAALVLLMIFEAVSAGFAESKVTDPWLYLGWITMGFLPYALLSWLARAKLHEAQGIVDQFRALNAEQERDGSDEHVPAVD